MVETGITEWLGPTIQGLVGISAAVCTYFLGRFQARNQSADKRSDDERKLLQARLETESKERDEERRQLLLKQAAEAREREQILEHYNRLIQISQAANKALTDDLKALHIAMDAMRKKHDEDSAAMRKKHDEDIGRLSREHENCRVENERQKAEIRHLRAELTELRVSLEKDQ